MWGELCSSFDVFSLYVHMYEGVCLCDANSALPFDEFCLYVSVCGWVGLHVYVCMCV